MKILLTLTTVTLLNLSLLQAQEIVNAEDKFIFKPIVKMTLNGKDAWMLLDTGSSVNVLDESAYKRYGFQTYRPYHTARNVVGFASGELSLENVGKIDLRYKGVELKGDFLAYDISNIVASFLNETGRTITGIIGSKMMRDYGFTIDMGNQTAGIHYTKKKSRKRKPRKVRQKTADEITRKK